jgi:ADP-Ribosyltransferase in polyvalent proteins
MQSDLRRWIDLVEAQLPPDLMHWFGDSKVRDADGSPLVVYHGTSNPNFKKFKFRGGLGGSLGFWFASSRQAAEQFAKPRFAGVQPGVKACILHIVQPKEYASYEDFVSAVRERMRGGSIEDGMRSLRRSVIRAGYDGMVIRNSDTDMGGVRDDWVAFDPKQINELAPNLTEGSDAERASIVANIEDEYRLPNLAASLPPEHLHPVVKMGSPTVTIYRGVPPGVTDIRPGDWVALTRRYAAQHVREGGGQVISKRVPARDVAWAGTDENEYYYVPMSA